MTITGIFATHIRGPQRINSNGFDDPLTYLLAPKAGQSFYLFSDLYLHLLMNWHK